MNYKDQIKSDELLTKLRIIRLVKRGGQTRVNVAQSFSCHRNTVSNLITTFEALFTPVQQQKLLFGSFTHQELMSKLTPLKAKSCRPHRHPHQATPKQEATIVSLFQDKNIKVGYQRMRRIVNRRYYDSHDPLEISLSQLPLGKIRGIYGRNRLLPEKVKSSNGDYKPLYDYTALACFERLHADVKYLADKSMLPEDIYHLIKDNSDIPNYQWGILDAKSRLRLVAYSYHLNAEFGLRFLAFGLQFIRSITSNWDTQIEIGVDNGSEFCAGSERKAKEWNHYLAPLNASLYTYHPGHDVRKNLIERSHLDDDYEWLVARGHKFTDKQTFQKETQEYFTYRNFQRSHSGIGMNGRTPYEVIKDSKLLGAKQLIRFPIIILEDHIHTLRQATDLLIYQQEYHNLPTKYPDLTPDSISLKDKFEVQPRYQFLKNYAQKVLTQDRSPPSNH